MTASDDSATSWLHLILQLARSHNPQRVPFASQAFIGDASVSYTADHSPWGGADWGVGGVGGGSGAAAPPQQWQSEAGNRAGAAPRSAAVMRPPTNDGGGAYTCQEYDPARDALPVNATVIRRLALAAPARLPGGFSSVSQPSVDDVIAFVATHFNAPAASFRLAKTAQPGDADRVDDLGMRHLRLEQVQHYMDQIFGVEFGALQAHLRVAPDGGGVEVYMVTGGYIDDIDGKLAAGAKRGGPNGGTQGGVGLVSGEAASGIGVDAALETAPRGGFIGSGGFGGLLGRGGLTATSARDAEMAAAEGRNEPAGARGKAEAVIYCTDDGACHPAWRQPVFVPMGYAASKAPRELHVYVSARDGSVIAKHDRLKTWGGQQRAARRFNYRSGVLEDGPTPDGGGVLGSPQQQPGQQQAAPTAINRPAAQRYDGPSMVPTQGVGETLYSGTVPLDTAQVTRPTRRGGARATGQFVMTDLKRLGQQTYDLMGRDDKARDAAVTGTPVTDRRNQW